MRWGDRFEPPENGPIWAADYDECATPICDGLVHFRDGKFCPECVAMMESGLVFDREEWAWVSDPELGPQTDEPTARAETEQEKNARLYANGKERGGLPR